MASISGRYYCTLYSVQCTVVSKVRLTPPSLTLRYIWHRRVWHCGIYDTAELDTAVYMTPPSLTQRCQFFAQALNYQLFNTCFFGCTVVQQMSCIYFFWRTLPLKATRGCDKKLFWLRGVIDIAESLSPLKICSEISWEPSFSSNESWVHAN